MSQMQPVPVLPKVYAQTFVNLRHKVEPDARLWQWWDYGYAGQYYAERLTFGDGGAHDGKWLYPLARVHSTDSALQASQLMKYVTQVQRSSSGSSDEAVYYWSNPLSGLELMGASTASAFVDNLASSEQNFSVDLPPQYLVLSGKICAWVAGLVIMGTGIWFQAYPLLARFSCCVGSQARYIYWDRYGQWRASSRRFP